MILIHEVARSTDYLTVYRDSSDPKLFYYIPQFAEVAKRNDGRLNFGAVLLKKNENDPNDGFSLYNFGVRGIYPSSEINRVLQDLTSQYGPGVALQPINPSVEAPSLYPITDGIYRSIRCQKNGGNLFTDLSGSFTIDESLEPAIANLMQSAVGWVGEVKYKIISKRVTFEWMIKANWRRVHEHFKSQVSVQFWFVKTNLSYEVQKLIENGTITVDITGGTPDQREKIFTMAETIAARMFKPTIQPNPLPGHPSGAAVCVSVNYSKTFEDKVEVWSGKVSEFEEKDLGMAVYLNNIPSSYFIGFNREDGSREEIKVDLDKIDSHDMGEFWGRFEIQND